MPMSTNNWIFKDGVTSQGTYNTFPDAFKAMFNTMKRGVERGRKYNEMLKQLVIIAPTKDQHGDFRKYDYMAATELAKSSDLLTPEGIINSRVFKRQ